MQPRSVSSEAFTRYIRFYFGGRLNPLGAGDMMTGSPGAVTDVELEIKGAVQPSVAAGAVRPSCDSSWGNICRRASHGRCVAAPGPAVGEVPCAVPRPRTRTLCRRRRPRGLWRGFHDEEVALEMKAPRTRFADEELEL